MSGNAGNLHNVPIGMSSSLGAPMAWVDGYKEGPGPAIQEYSDSIQRSTASSNLLSAHKITSSDFVWTATYNHLPIPRTIIY